VTTGSSSTAAAQAGIHIGNTTGDVTFSALGDIVAGNKTVSINTTINIAVDAVTQRPLLPSSPYRGLKRFEDRDKDIFFGRDQLIAELLTHLGKENVRLIIGASGSGKSSLIRAGLLPTFARFIGPTFRYFVLVPDIDPFESLRSTLHAAGFSQSDTKALLEQAVGVLSRVLERLRPPGERWLFFIDQLEELFTSCSDDLRSRFLSELVHLASTGVGSTKLVMAMRSEFVERFGSFPDFAQLIQQRITIVADMRPDELRLAIEQPAAGHGVVFEAGLVDDIIRDVLGQPGGLPLLGYALDLLWTDAKADDDLASRHLRAATYRRRGGVRGAVERRSEEIYVAFAAGTGAEQKNTKQDGARRIFLRLVDFSEGASVETAWHTVRRRVPRTQFAQSDEQTVLQTLIDENLLVSDRHDAITTVEVAHEALFASWSRLKNWIEDGRQVIYVRNRLSDDAARWHRLRDENGGSADDELWGGSRLEQALDMSSRGDFAAVLGRLDAEESAFLDASVAVREARLQQERENAAKVSAERERRLAADRLARRVLIALVLFLLITAGSATVLWRRAHLDALSRARVAAESIFSTAQTETADKHDLLRGILHVDKALRVTPPDWPRRGTYAARFAHMTTLAPARVVSLDGRVLGGVVSADGGRVLIVRPHGAVEVRDGHSGALVRTLFGSTTGQAPTGRAVRAAISDNGRYAAILRLDLNKEGTTSVLGWDLQNDQVHLTAHLPPELGNDPGGVRLAASDDGWVVASVEQLQYDLFGLHRTSSAEMGAWHLSTGAVAPDRRPDLVEGGNSLRGQFSVAPAAVATVAIARTEAHHALAVLKTLSGNSVDLRPVAPDTNVSSMQWSRDGRAVVIGWTDGDHNDLTYRAYDAASGASFALPPTRPEDHLTIADIQNETILYGGGDPKRGVVQVKASSVQKPDEAPLLEFPATDPITFVAFGTEGHSLVVLTDDTLYVVDSRDGSDIRPAIHLPAHSLITRVIKDHGSLFSVSDDGILAEWALSRTYSESERSPAQVKQWQDASVVAAALSPDGNFAALVHQQGYGLEVGVVAVAGPGAVGLPTAWTSIGKLMDVAGDDAPFHRANGIAVNAAGVMTLAGQTTGAPPIRQRIVVGGGAPCELPIGDAELFRMFTNDGRGIVSCDRQAEGCRVWTATTCAPALPGGAAVLFPIGSLGDDLLEHALSVSSFAARMGATAGVTRLIFPHGEWRTIASSKTGAWTDAATGLEVIAPRSRHQRVEAVSPDGKLLAVMSRTQNHNGFPGWTLDVWDALTGRPLAEGVRSFHGGRDGGDPLLATTFSADGRWLFILTADGLLSREWMQGTGNDDECIGESSKALLGYRMAGDVLVEALDPVSLSAAQKRASMACRKAAAAGDAGAEVVLRVEERSAGGKK
jgi:hypothetical protein